MFRSQDIYITLMQIYSILSWHNQHHSVFPINWHYIAKQLLGKVMTWLSSTPCTLHCYEPCKWPTSTHITPNYSLLIKNSPYFILSTLLLKMGTAVAQWLRCCSTNWKVAGSIPDGVIGIFHWHNPSERTMVHGSTQPLTEMSTRSISSG